MKYGNYELDIRKDEKDKYVLISEAFLQLFTALLPF